MTTLVWWCLEHWWLVVWISAVVLAWRIGGWRLAAAVGSFGLGWQVYAVGRARGRDEIERRERERSEDLKEQYDAIDDRPRDPADAYDRLRERARRR